MKQIFLSLLLLIASPLISGPVESNNEFALDAYDLMTTTSGNRLFSPFSALSALAMTSLGAKDQTYDEMAGVLYIGSDADQWHSEFGSLNRFVSGGDKESGWFDFIWGAPERPFVFQIANKIYVDETRELQPEFADNVFEHYGAYPTKVDFQFDSNSARQEINRYVEEVTKDKIKDLLAPGSVNEMTRLVLVNALYLKALWSAPFDPEHTKEEEFQVLQGPDAMVSMMFRHGKYNVHENSSYTALELPFQTQDEDMALAMRIYLPREVEGIDFVENVLVGNRELLNDLAWEKRTVHVWLPRIKIEDKQELRNHLVKLGMPTAFYDLADFSGMTGTKDLSISAVVQKTFFEIDEKGAEGAAATAVVVVTRSLGPPPVMFRADHPFLFTIVDKTTGLILFIGRFEQP